MSYEIKVGDLDPPIPAFLLDQDEAAVDQAGRTVAFRWRLKDSGEAGFNAPQAATVVDAPTAEVEYRFVVGETDIEGDYEGEWQSDDGLGNVRTFPSGQGIYHNFRINT